MEIQAAQKHSFLPKLYDPTDLGILKGPWSFAFEVWK